MLSRKFKSILFHRTTNSNAICGSLIPSRSFSKWFDALSNSNTNSIKFKIFKELLISRILNGWTRSYIINTVVRKCRSEKGVREVLQYFRHVFLKPRRTHLLVTVTAAYKKTEEKPGMPKKCSKNIKDKEMKNLISDLDGVEELSEATLFCEGCSKRVVIDNKNPGVRYCSCKGGKPPQASFEGWVPYMEAEDVIIWRKEYKPGGLYAYKVYGRYKHIKADDFAMIQVDGAYRKVWDNAVASLSVVEREANGIKDQDVLHWEVLWPRLFANRDYVYIRRYKEFEVKSSCQYHKDSIFESETTCTMPQVEINERPSVHSHAKKISMENELKAKRSESKGELIDNKVYVIVSRSCVHPSVPESKNAIRVLEYWSHMVVTTLNGPDEPGMEFVLTYYDEPAVGGLPAAVTAWAMGRAGPAFLQRMKAAAADYHSWRMRNAQKTPDFTPFSAEKVSFENDEPVAPDAEEPLSEQDMESSKQGPDMEGSDDRKDSTSHDAKAGGDKGDALELPSNENEQKTESPPKSIQLEEVENKLETSSDSSLEKKIPDETKISVDAKNPVEANIPDVPKIPEIPAAESPAKERVDEENDSSWWKYLYPLYYFV